MTETDRLDALEQENLHLRKNLVTLLTQVGELHQSVLETQRMLSDGTLRQMVQRALGAEYTEMQKLTTDAVKILGVLVQAGLVEQDALNAAAGG